MHIVVVFLYTCCAILIVPFVKVYTNGITDANYVAPLFGVLIAMSQMIFCLRLPYNAMVFAAGHYRQTQNSALIEATINIVVSVICVFQFGLLGVALGTLVAMTYRTIYLVWYLRNNIMMRPARHFVKHIVIDILVIGLSLAITSNMEMMTISYVSWLLLSVKVAVIVAAISLMLNSVCYMDLLKCGFAKLLRKQGR